MRIWSFWNYLQPNFAFLIFWTWQPCSLIHSYSRTCSLSHPLSLSLTYPLSLSLSLILSLSLTHPLSSSFSLISLSFYQSLLLSLYPFLLNYLYLSYFLYFNIDSILFHYQRISTDEYCILLCTQEMTGGGVSRIEWGVGSMIESKV